MMRKIKEEHNFRVSPRYIPRESAYDGFTIVELLVAMGVFVILLGIIVGIFISSLRTQRGLAALMLVNDNTSLVLEQMAREIRVGENFSLPPAVPPDSALNFISPAGNVTYKLDNGRIVREVDGGGFLPITGDNVKIAKLKFYLLFSLPSWPPRVTITLTVTPRRSLEDVITTNIQTTVSGRNL